MSKCLTSSVNAVASNGMSTPFGSPRHCVHHVELGRSRRFTLQKGSVFRGMVTSQATRSHLSMRMGIRSYLDSDAAVMQIVSGWTTFRLTSTKERVEV